MLEREQIEAKIPHRGKALLLDRFKIDSERNIGVGYLIVTEEICEGHFPNNPIMRGVDRIEMIALTLGLFSLSNFPEGKLPYLVAVGKSRFPSSAVVGDEIRSEVTTTKRSAKMIRGNGRAYVGERLVAEVKDILCFIRDVSNSS